MRGVLRPKSGNYRITSFLGEGGLGQVYKAIRADSMGRIEQPVALKILRSQELVQDLIYEIEALSSIRSPYCVSLYGWEDFGGQLALIMEWVDGVSLHQVLKNGPLPGNLVDEIIAQLQGALRDLSLCGRFHGDLSFSNILVDKTGRIRLIDFGLSAIRRENSAPLVSGTPRFMSPERWMGYLPAAADDMFSLGLIEKDLRSGECIARHTRKYWKQRAFEAINSSSYLHEEPSKRKFRDDLVSDPRSRAVLADLVVRLSQTGDEKTETFYEGRPASKSNPLRNLWRFLFHRFFALPIFIYIVFFPNIPFGEAVFRKGFAPTATLEVRTLKWVRVRLGFQELGFSPIIKKDIPAGIHHLHWRSAFRSGIKTLTLGYGERKILTDSDFR